MLQATFSVLRREGGEEVVHLGLQSFTLEVQPGNRQKSLKGINYYSTNTTLTYLILMPAGAPVAIDDYFINIFSNNLTELSLGPQ